MTPSNMHPATAARGFRRARLQAASDLVTARAHRRSADRVRARPRREALEGRCLLSGISGYNEYSNPSSNPFSWQITTGPDGNLVFTDGSLSTSQIGMINTTTGAVTDFTTPTAGSAPTGPDGNLWFTESAGKIGTINPTTDAITQFPVPSANSSPWAITGGPDGNLRFSEGGVGKIGMINPSTDAITEFPVPYTGASPRAITVGPDANLRFTDSGTKSIGVAFLTTSNLVVTQQPPSSVTAGSPFGLTVEAEDSPGDLLSSCNGTMTVALANNPGGATLGGTLTATASNGVATFSGLTLTKAASGYTLAATSNGLGQGVTNAKTVTPAAATQLVITQQPPATVQLNKAIALKASIEGAYGNVVTTASGTVSVAFANNPTGATLGGTLTVTSSGGVASFTDLTINKTGSGYTLQVSSSGLSSAVTNAITVTKKGTSGALAVTTTTTTPDPMLAPLVLDSPNLWAGLGFKKRSHAV